MAHDQFSLPLKVVSQGDAMRLKRELTVLSEYIKQADLRRPGTVLETLPKTSASLHDFTQDNDLNLLKVEDRDAANSFLAQLVEQAPVIHISFASEPSAAFMHKIASWFREQIDPLILINVGLEPSIAAGFTLRTLNQYHDFSLRQQFSDHRELLLNGIREPSNTQPA